MVAACPFPAARGTPIRIFHMANELARRGHEVDLFTYHLGHDIEEPRFRVYRTPNISGYRKWSPGPSVQKLMLLDPMLSVMLLRAMRTRSYEVIHAHHVEGLLAAVPARVRYRVPVVFDAHTTLESELPSYSQRGRTLLKQVGRAVDARLPARADHVIAVSEEIEAKLTLSHGVAGERISVIPNGVEDEFFCADGGTTPIKNGSGPNLVFAGNMAPYQGIDLLLESFAKALKQRGDLRLKFISQDPLDPYEELATRLGVRDNVDLVDADVDQLPGLLAEASVLLNPRTEGDGSPQKILNYMAAGRPIVTFAGTARHLMDGQDALIVPNGDIDAFAQAILRLCSDRALAQRLGGGAQRSARSKFTWTQTAARVERVYARLAPTVSTAQ